MSYNGYAIIDWKYNNPSPVKTLVKHVTRGSVLDAHKILNLLSITLRKLDNINPNMEFNILVDEDQYRNGGIRIALQPNNDALRGIIGEHFSTTITDNNLEWEGDMEVYELLNMLEEAIPETDIEFDIDGEDVEDSHQISTNVARQGTKVHKILQELDHAILKIGYELIYKQGIVTWFYIYKV